MMMLRDAYRAYCAIASRKWPIIWAVRAEIPLLCCILAPLYALIAYLTAKNFSESLRLLDVADGYLSVLGSLFAGAGLTIWLTAVTRSLLLPYAPRLKIHPDAGLLTVFSLCFVALPLCTGIGMTFVYQTFGGQYPHSLWGSLGQSGKLSISLLAIAIFCCTTSFLTNFCTIARLEGILTALGSALLLFVYIVVGIVVFATLSLDLTTRNTREIVIVSILGTVICVPVIWSWRATSHRFRLILFHPAFLLVSAGVFLIGLKLWTFGDQQWENTIFDFDEIGNYVPVLFAVIGSTLFSSVFSWLLRRQMRLPSK
jgi:hypothetical protein